MADARRKKWNHRFAGAQLPNLPAAVLDRNSHLLPAKGLALDLACGLGGNSILMAGHGLDVEAWDISDTALAKLQTFATSGGLAIDTHQIDLEQPLSWERQYDVIVVAHFLYRPLCAGISEALNPGGLIFYQTYTQSKTGDGGPENPRYLLDTNELLSLFKPLQLVYYREDRRIGNTSRGERDLAYFIGQKPDPALGARSPDLQLF